MNNNIVKSIKYFLMLIGIIVIIYGFIQDYDLITFSGTFLFVSGIMLNSIIEIFTVKKST